jgi:hypothetical protein
MSGVVSEAAKSVGTSAVDSLKQALSDVPSAMDTNIDISPTITPVLDLTSIKRDAAQIDGLLKPKNIETSRSFESAKNAAAGVPVKTPVDTTSSEKTDVSPVTFIQNNNSPKALSTVDIYRQTKTQLASVKGGV